MRKMYRYSGYGLGIDSELELPELPAGDGEPDVVIRLGSVPANSRPSIPDEEFAFNTLAGAFRIRGGTEIIVDPLPGAAPGALNVVLLGKIMAFLLRQRGWLPLHASVVVVDGQAVLFLAPSGGGKSTTAAAFHARGHMAVADDIGAVRVVNQQSIVRPAWGRIRLPDDSCELLAGLNLQSEFHFDKHTYRLSATNLRRSFPVNRIYSLEFGEELRTEVLAPLEAVAVLSRHSFARHRILGKEALRIHLRECASVASATGVYRLERPRSLSGLSALAGMVEKSLGRYD
jgi:hypothetical protein